MYRQSLKVENGVLLLGNSGAGKSFLANVFLGRECFKHLCNPKSVTRVAEFESFESKSKKYAIFNIPGLIEDDQNAIDRNKQEIHKAFDMCVNTYIIFVFNGGSAGRIRNEDIVAFNAINKAYEFDTKSLMLVVNDLPPDRPEDYNDLTGLRLQEHLKLKERPVIVFLERIDKTSDDQKKRLHSSLLSGVEKLQVAVHEKKGDELELEWDKIKILIEQIKSEQANFDLRLEELQKAEPKDRELRVSDDTRYKKWEAFENWLKKQVAENRINKEMAERIDALTVLNNSPCNVQ